MSLPARGFQASWSTLCVSVKFQSSWGNYEANTETNCRNEAWLRFSTMSSAVVASEKPICHRGCLPPYIKPTFCWRSLEAILTWMHKIEFAWLGVYGLHNFFCHSKQFFSEMLSSNYKQALSFNKKVQESTMDHWTMNGAVADLHKGPKRK